MVTLKVPLMRSPKPRGIAIAGLAFALLLISGGCAKPPKTPYPFHKLNRFTYKINDVLDKIILKPASDVYVKVIPKPIRKGLGNFFDNVGYGNVIVNDLLQGHFKQALGGTARMAINTTVGVAGVFDVATKWNIPAHQNDFGITLGKWGAGPGPYLVLPLLGPSTFRDVPRIPVGMYTSAMRYIDLPDSISIPLDILSLAEDRTRADAAIKFRDQASLDPYIFMREAYLQYRRIKIYGEAKRVDETFYDDDDMPTTRPTTRPSTQPDTLRLPPSF